MPERLRGIRRVVDAYPDRMLVEELYLLDLIRFVGYLNTGDRLHLAHWPGLSEAMPKALGARPQRHERNCLTEPSRPRLRQVARHGRQ
jgi:hypothetical protein